jgi:hypothetical protein
VCKQLIPGMMMKRRRKMRRIGNIIMQALRCVCEHLHAVWSCFFCALVCVCVCVCDEVV